ncbi:hypothetical protein GCM10007977_030950 [Dactylosporangium sucinum]|uniref:Polynucleotide kinase PNKP phosphatase domain-containing protein n=1 Tax=Dactylosporangium sucinum TaxID=1424081 RepID=A0A917TNM2_9ACTN|nr:hypothetical protein GCM10007977_030950 [Dactylosporangium sucinum]
MRRGVTVVKDVRVNSSIAVFDIDGVVADVRHRLHHLDHRPKNWSRFFAAAGRDPALATGVTLAREYAASHVLVWLTGRPEHLRTVTTDWLHRHELPAELLFMRPSTDRRPSRDFKAGQLARLARESPIEIVVDDDPEVIAKLQGLGYPVRLADWVPHSSTLEAAQEREGRT